MKLSKLLACFIFNLIGNNLLAQNPHETVTQIINTKEYTEYAPTVSADGKTLFFEGDRVAGGGWQIYESRFKDGKWSVPISIDPINKFGAPSDLIGGPSVSYDGNTLFFFASFAGGLGREDIYYAERQGDTWSSPKNLGAPINTAGYEGFPSISADGKRLYFVRENPESRIGQKQDGKLFCLKIFVSEKDKKGNWQEPIPLPDPINLDCESSPRIMSDNRTLIFASVRANEKNEKIDNPNFDLYLSKMDDEGYWQSPQPLKFANTTDNDYAASVAASGDVLYYFNQKDLKVMDIPSELRQQRNITIQGYVRDAFTHKELEAQINIYDARTTEQIMQLKSNASDGRYTAVLSEGKRYNIEVTKPGFSSYTLDFDLSKLEKYQEFQIDVEIYSQINLLLSINDFEIHEPIDAKLKVIDLSNNQEINALTTKIDEVGRKELMLPTGKKYRIRASAENFIDTSFVFDLTGVIKYQLFERDLALHPKRINYALNISDKDNNSGIPVEIVLVNKNRDEKIILTPEMSSNGTYNIPIRQGDEYEVDIKIPKGYALFGEHDINSKNQQKEKRSKLDIKLTPLKPNVKLDLYDISFESGSADLNDNSVKELNRILTCLEANPSLRIEIAAHTDNKSTADFNMLLSQKRAKSVEEYLVGKSIDRKRLIAKGYGLSQPLVPNDSPENMARNRRFELVIISL